MVELFGVVNPRPPVNVGTSNGSLEIKGQGQEKNGAKAKFWSRLNFIAKQQAYKGKNHKPNP